MSSLYWAPQLLWVIKMPLPHGKLSQTSGSFLKLTSHMLRQEHNSTGLLYQVDLWNCNWVTSWFTTTFSLGIASILSTSNIEDNHRFAKCHFSCNFAYFVHLASCAWVKKFITGDTPAAAAQKTSWRCDRDPELYNRSLQRVKPPPSRDIILLLWRS